MSRRYIDAEFLRTETERRIKEANESRMAIVDSDFLDLINDAPTEDVVEVRHGHWIEHTAKPDWLEDDVEVFYNCSECGSSHWSIIPPYCPNCGAKMDGGKDDGT